MCPSEARERFLCVCVFLLLFSSLKKEKKKKKNEIPCSLTLLSLIIHQSSQPFIKQAVKGACWQGTCTDWEAAKACKSSEKHHERQRRGSCAQCLRNRLVLQKGKKAQRHFRRS